MRIDAVTDATFTAEVLESEKPVLVDFTAAWCPPCRAMNPILDEIAASRDDLRIVKLDVDDNQSVAAQYGVLSMPTFMLFNHGAPIQTLVGSRPRKRLESELEQALVQEPAGR
jgi:thioredoxin 1